MLRAITDPVFVNLTFKGIVSQPGGIDSWGP
jgi:hypothetical protein